MARLEIPSELTGSLLARKVLVKETRRVRFCFGSIIGTRSYVYVGHCVL